MDDGGRSEGPSFLRDLILGASLPRRRDEFRRRVEPNFSQEVLPGVPGRTDAQDIALDPNRLQRPPVIPDHMAGSWSRPAGGCDRLPDPPERKEVNGTQAEFSSKGDIDE